MKKMPVSRQALLLRRTYCWIRQLFRQNYLLCAVPRYWEKRLDSQARRISGDSPWKGSRPCWRIVGRQRFNRRVPRRCPDSAGNQVKGERDSGWYSPASWNDEEWQAARGGFAGGALLGVPGNIATAFSPEEQNATTGNAMKDAVIRGYQDEGMEPQIGLAMAARESGGDVNAIHMADNGGLMQITEESARDYGVNETYPNWRTDPYENARASAYILKQKIKEQGGDVWDGVRAYNGAGRKRTHI